MRLVTNAATPSDTDVRRVEEDGTEYLVAPGIFLREKIYSYPEDDSEELLPAEEISESVDRWNGQPIRIGHPTQSPAPEIGEFRNAEELDGGSKLRAEPWIDTSLAERHPDGRAIVRSIEDGDTLSVSPGYNLGEFDDTPGRHNGVEYDGVQRGLIPDHVAVFPPDSAAQARCLPSEGCALPRANASDPSAMPDEPLTIRENALSTARTPEYSDVADGGSWERPDLDAYIQAYAENTSGFDAEDASDVSDLSQDAKQWIAEKSLLGSADAETYDDLAVFPVVTPNGVLVEAALDAVLSTVGLADISDETAESVRTKARGLLQEEFNREFEDRDNAAADPDTLGQRFADLFREFIAPSRANASTQEIGHGDLVSWNTGSGRNYGKVRELRLRNSGFGSDKADNGPRAAPAALVDVFEPNSEDSDGTGWQMTGEKRAYAPGTLHRLSDGFPSPDRLNADGTLVDPDSGEESAVDAESGGDTTDTPGDDAATTADIGTDADDESDDADGNGSDADQSDADAGGDGADDDADPDDGDDDPDPTDSEDSEKTPDELAESSTDDTDSDPNDSVSNMEDSQKIDFLVEERGLDRENVSHLEGEECLDTIYTDAQQTVEEQRANAEDDGSGGGESSDGESGDSEEVDVDVEVDSSDGGGSDSEDEDADSQSGGDHSDDERVNALASELAEIKEELNAVKEKNEKLEEEVERPKRERRANAAETVSEHLGISEEAARALPDEDLFEKEAEARGQRANAQQTQNQPTMAAVQTGVDRANAQDGPDEDEIARLMPGKAGAEARNGGGDD